MAGAVQYILNLSDPSGINGVVGIEHEVAGGVKKKSLPVDRQMTTPLFLLRCVQIGLSLSDLDLLTIGMVNEMFIEKDNDDYDYPIKATQEQMDLF